MARLIKVKPGKSSRYKLQTEDGIFLGDLWIELGKDNSILSLRLGKKGASIEEMNITA